MSIFKKVFAMLRGFDNVGAGTSGRAIAGGLVAPIADTYGIQWMRIGAPGAAGGGPFSVAIFTPSDAFAVPANSLLGVENFAMAFDGVDWYQLRSASAANFARAVGGVGAELSATPAEWSQTNAPAAATIATTTKAAAAGVAHVCRSITAMGDTAHATAPLLVLRDGLSGVGAILWSVYVPLGLSGPVSVPGLNIVGTAGNAMTLEFTSAPSATGFQSVALSGYDVN